MSLVSLSQYDSTLEQHLERWALAICLPTTFVQCLQDHNIVTAIQFISSKGKSITIRGSDLADSRTWKKFLTSVAHERKAYSLCQDAANLIELYQGWLLREHTTRYQGITSNVHRVWLQQVTVLVVVRSLLWHKYERYVSGEHDAIVDPWVANTLHQLRLLREATKELPRLVHHIVDNPEYEQHLIEEFFFALEERVKHHTLATPDPLPPLPEGASRPLLLLSEKLEGSDE